ncbi:unnamed protein product [Moneuplotes crassus]|uniref:Uncharacterized protein n=1 Tax=Euplotes crassus TaxID=5936 RepID=A0AAD2D6Y8_EUPCR|nr:unnamed protein product [Moneuplotes crassus]
MNLKTQKIRLPLPKKLTRRGLPLKLLLINLCIVHFQSSRSQRDSSIKPSKAVLRSDRGNSRHTRNLLCQATKSCGGAGVLRSSEDKVKLILM